MSDFVFCFSGC